MFWTAFTMGLVGSLHCVGMCGPIALALPYQDGSRWRAASNVLLYNLGRVSTYALLGTVIGLLGKGLFLAGLQAYFSIAIGALLLLAALFSINIERQLLTIPLLNRLNGWVKVKLSLLLKQNSRGTLFLIGALNGLLPCGLVYMAVIGAVTMPNVLDGAVYMGLFGFGTLPLMLSTAIAGQFVSLQWRSRARRLIPIFLAAFALFFIWRGLQFAAPLEMRFWENMDNVPMCH
ncbi:MAG: sulfite exporter TauE/SafE family protein [Saprospiraceae bacterium]